MSSQVHINEIFKAPQGEGRFAGMPMVFVRLQGCNLRCEFCDTTGAIARQGHPSSSSMHDTRQLAEKLLVEYGDNRVVCFTGGEPLLQIGAVIKMAIVLREHGWKVHLETNGTITLTMNQAKHFDWITVSPKGPRWTLAIPGKWVNELKFVMPSEHEYWGDLNGTVWAGHEKVHAAAEMCPDAFLWFQPVSNEPKAIEWCLRLLDAYQAAYHPAPLTMGLSVQVHKLIGTK